MDKTTIFKQKQTAVGLIVLGVLIGIGAAAFGYFGAAKTAGLPDLLPADKTVIYVEFPAALDGDITKLIKERLDIEWNSEILPWISEKNAFALLSDDENGPGLAPLVILQIKSKEGAAEFLKKHAGSKIKSAFADNILILSNEEKALSAVTLKQSAIAPCLGSDGNFIKIRRNVEGGFFVYFKPREIPKMAYAPFLKSLPSMPFLTLPFPAVGMAAKKIGNAWQGKTYAVTEKDLALVPEQAYRALALPFLPPEFETLLAGQNLAGQIDKLDSMLEGKMSAPQIKTLFALLSKEYLAGAPLRDADARAIKSLFTKEFALTVNGEKILLIIEAQDPLSEQNIEQARAMLKTAASRLTPAEREITLPDGTKAAELVPDTNQIAQSEKNFEGISIKSLSAGKNGKTIYDALAQGKWFASNDENTIKKALLLTKEPGLQFMESERYKTLLQPILKNPELLGVAAVPGFRISFSKRTFTDHMEAAWMIAR